MRERPILFSAPMVRANLRDVDPKTQTRRICKLEVRAGMSEPEWASLLRCCPYGQPGDRLWVRETFFAFGRWETRFSAKKGRDEWHFIDLTLEAGHQYAYPADGYRIAPHRRTAGVTPMWCKRPAIHMPRAASRVLLEVTDVRLERLQDISEADAIAEGLTPLSGGADRTWTVDGDARSEHLTARDTYAWLWDEINGPGSWDANPWVWVVSFRRLAC